MLNEISNSLHVKTAPAHTHWRKTYKIHTHIAYVFSMDTFKHFLHFIFAAFKCEYCDRAFTQSGDLNKHLRSHIGEKTYQCECGEKFRLQIELRKHSYQHFQESQKNPN